jgi:hypothetical protein
MSPVGTFISSLSDEALFAVGHFKTARHRTLRVDAEQKLTAKNYYPLVVTYIPAIRCSNFLISGNNSQPEPVQDRESMMIHSGTVLAERFFSGNSASNERIANLSSLGLDRWWKRQIAKKIPDNPARIVDQAWGTGLLTFRIAQRFPLCRIWGVDLQDEYLGVARQKAQALQLTTVEFIRGRAEDVVLLEILTV